MKQVASSIWNTFQVKEDKKNSLIMINKIDQSLKEKFSELLLSVLISVDLGESKPEGQGVNAPTFS